MRLLRRGKVKDVYEVDGGTLEFHFSARVSVFDKIIPTNIPNKGETLCRTSAFWFRTAGDMGVGNHFKELVAANRMRVARFDIRDRLDRSSTCSMVPLEFVCRHYVAGSLYDRLKGGEVAPEELGLKPGGEFYGRRLPEPMLELTTKFEKFDRKLDVDEAMKISSLDRRELEGIEETILRLDERMGREVGKRGLIHVDGKKEFALDAERRPVVVDTFGTADEDRFWDAAKYNEGTFVELSKEFVRQHYRKTGYHKKLTEARDGGLDEPDIPALPADVAKEVDGLYIGMYERLTGESFGK